MCPALFSTSHVICSPARCLAPASLWSAHRMLWSTSCHQADRKASRAAPPSSSCLMCHLPSNSSHLAQTEAVLVPMSLPTPPWSPSQSELLLCSESSVGGPGWVPPRHRGLTCWHHVSLISLFPLIKTRSTPLSSSAQTLLNLCFCMFLIFHSPPATPFIILSPPSFFFQTGSLSLFFSPIKGSQCLQLFGCRHRGQKFWHGVV